jgi:hypothetical protein
MGLRSLDFSKGGKQTPLGLPGSGLQLPLEPATVGACGAGVGASVVTGLAGLAVLAAIVMAVVFFGR